MMGARSARARSGARAPVSMEAPQGVMPAGAGDLSQIAGGNASFPLSDGLSAGLLQAGETPLTTEDAMAGMALPGAPKIKPKFFDETGLGSKLLRGLGEFALQYSANNGNAGSLALLQHRYGMQRQNAEQARDLGQWQRQRAAMLEDRNAEQNRPQFFSGAEDRLRYDPATGETSTLYDAPTPAQEYAQGMGYQPDSPEYRTAMQDYTLKGYGATAMAARMQQDQQRTEDRLAVRSAPTYRDTHARPASPARPRAQASYAPPRTTNAVVAPILAKMSRGVPLNPSEQAVLDYNRRGGGGRGRAEGAAKMPASDAPTATDPRTGKKMQYVNGAWVQAR